MFSTMLNSLDNKKPRQVLKLTGAQSSGNALLEEWPCRDSIKGLKNMSLKPSKTVTFSEYSCIRKYLTHEIEKKKSYKSADIKMFKAQARRDASRVAELVATCPHKGGMAVYHLIDTGALKVEELVGIDQLIGGEDKERKIAFDRFAHSKVVTRKQHGMNVVQLAYLSKKSSSRNMNKAVQRARLAEMGTEANGCTVKPKQLKDESRCRRIPAVAA